MGDVNWFHFIFNTYERLTGFADIVYNFLYYEINILDIATVSLWEFIGGVSVTVILAASIVKRLVPFL